MTTTPKLLLSMDGGGLRGIIPAMVLAKLEAQTGRPAGETFAFRAGTSTGAIIAAGLAAGVPATEIVRLYAEGSGRVIDERWWSWPVRQVRFYAHRGWQQNSARLHELIADTLGDRRDMRLNDPARRERRALALHERPARRAPLPCPHRDVEARPLRRGLVRRADVLQPLGGER